MWLCASCPCPTDSWHERSVETREAIDVRHAILDVELGGGTLGSAMLLCGESFRDRRALGHRNSDSQIVWQKFGDILDTVVKVARRLTELVDDEEGGYVGIVASNCVEWVVVDFAVTVAGLVSVPYYPMAPPEIICHVLGATKCRVLFADSIVAGKLDLSALPLLMEVVLLDSPTSWNSFLASSTSSSKAKLEHVRLGSKGRGRVDPFSVMFTSGTTDAPRGVVHSCGSWFKSLTMSTAWMFEPLVQVAWASFAHSSARRLVWTAFLSGGRTMVVQNRVGFNLDVILRDISSVSPSSLSSTPRFWQALFERFRSSLLSKEAATAELRAMFGRRLELITIGGACSSLELQHWLRECFGCSVRNGFGASEVGSVGSGNAGKPLKFLCEWRIRSVPSLAYDAFGCPPTGELLVKTPTMGNGYFGDEEATRAAFTEDGFFCTGDIVSICEDGKFVVVDRAKNVVKLAQGCFVALEFLESVFSACPGVSQICLHADPLRSFLIAVVVTTKDRSAALVMAELVEKAIVRNLASFECPRGIVMAVEPFTSENGLLTGSAKLCRRAIEKKYKLELSQACENLEKADKLLVEVIGRGVGDSLGAMSFLELGGDSLTASKLQQEAAQRLGMDLPIHWLLDQRKSLVEILGASTAVSERDVPGFEDAIFSTYDDSKPARVFFVTGATGFLGLFVVRSLLARDSHAIVHVLVRGRNVEDARDRLCKRAAINNLLIDWQRIQVHLGDLCQPKLGLDSDALAQIDISVECVIHVKIVYVSL